MLEVVIIWSLIRRDYAIPPVLISAEDKEQADTILDALLEKKLIFGEPILEGPAKFWWKGEICEMNYAYILT